MKLWLKITLGVTALTLLVLGGCLYYFSSSQAAYTLSSMEESELKMLDLFCINLSAIEKLNSIDTNCETVINSAVHYAFMTQARLLHSETVSYGLGTGDTLYANHCPYDLKDLLQLEDNQTRAWTTRVINGTYVFVACTRMTLFNHDYSIYLARDATSVFERIDALRRTALLLLITGMLLLSVLLPMIVKRALHPLKELSQTAQQIAMGNYSLRAHIDNTSEIGDMGKQFNLMADALEKKIEQLSELAQNRTLMLGALTHELKTPLTSIIGYADTYLHVPIDEAKKDYCVEQIFLAGQRTERLSQKLLQIISLEQSFTGQMHPINASELIDAVRVSTEKSLHAKQQALVISNNVTEIFGDYDLLLSLICNLIENASRASNEGKAIQLELSETQSETMLSVKDEGRGIPADQVKKITEPFYRIDKARDRKSGGAGLGLAICKAIADVHQGTLAIASEPNIGSCVTLTLPRC